ncbi:hypothetical protein THIX_10419 [Thiomonas sp. X19]|nr:hypothetical protein THIX_10419 [Thiomonas sp. X19]
MVRAGPGNISTQILSAPRVGCRPAPVGVKEIWDGPLHFLGSGYVAALVGGGGGDVSRETSQQAKQGRPTISASPPIEPHGLSQYFRCHRRRRGPCRHRGSVGGCARGRGDFAADAQH